MSAFPSQSELAKYEPTTQASTRDQLTYSFAKHDFMDAAVIAQGINAANGIATWLLNGGDHYDAAQGVGESAVLELTPLECYPASVSKAVDAFRRLITWAEQNAPTANAPTADVALEAGLADPQMAQWLSKCLSGGQGYTSSSLPSVDQRRKSLSTIGCKPSTVALAIGANVDDVCRWTATTDALSLPWQTAESTAFGNWLKAMRFLMSGPTYMSTAPTSKAVRAGQVF